MLLGHKSIILFFPGRLQYITFSSYKKDSAFLTTIIFLLINSILQRIFSQSSRHFVVTWDHFYSSQFLCSWLLPSQPQPNFHILPNIFQSHTMTFGKLVRLGLPINGHFHFSYLRCFRPMYFRFWDNLKNFILRALPSRPHPHIYQSTRSINILLRICLRTFLVYYLVFALQSLGLCLHGHTHFFLVEISAKNFLRHLWYMRFFPLQS